MPETPSREAALCSFCATPLKLVPHAVSARCMLCGERGRTRAWCTQGHYVCDECRGSDLLRMVEGLLADCRGTDPIATFIAFRQSREFPMHGPEHHPLVAAAFLVAYHNRYGEPSWPALLEACQNAALQLPGGTCGFWGACSAGLAVGMAYCAILDSSPTNSQPRAAAHRVVARILERMSQSTGPRCCRRESLLALQVGCELSEELLPHSLTADHRVICEQASANEECGGASCPFFQG